MQGVSGYSRAVEFSLEGDEAQIDSGMLIQRLPISPDYFKTMGIPLIAGRAFAAEDRSDGEPVAIVNQAFIRLLLQGRDPLGKRVRWEGFSAGDVKIDPLELKVVGLVKDTRQLSLSAEPEPQLYVPLSQSSSYYWGAVFRSALAVRFAPGQSESIAAIREVINSSGGGLQVESVRSMREIVSAQQDRPKVYLLCLGVFSLLALLLSAASTFSTTAHWMKVRRYEIGVRMAMGAWPARVRREVVAPIARLVGAGAVLGLGASYGAVRLLDSVIQGVSPASALILVPVSIFVAGLSLAVSCLAARGPSQADIRPLLRVSN